MNNPLKSKIAAASALLKSIPDYTQQIALNTQEIKEIQNKLLQGIADIQKVIQSEQQLDRLLARPQTILEELAAPNLAGKPLIAAPIPYNNISITKDIPRTSTLSTLENTAIAHLALHPDVVLSSNSAQLRPVPPPKCPDVSKIQRNLSTPPSKFQGSGFLVNPQVLHLIFQKNQTKNIYS